MHMHTCLHQNLTYKYTFSPTRGVFLRGSTFHNNTLPNAAGQATTGGAIYLNEGNATVLDSTFARNVGRRGGALYLVILTTQNI